MASLSSPGRQRGDPGRFQRGVATAWNVPVPGHWLPCGTTLNAGQEILRSFRNCWSASTQRVWRHPGRPYPWSHARLRAPRADPLPLQTPAPSFLPDARSLRRAEEKQEGRPARRASAFLLQGLSAMFARPKGWLGCPAYRSTRPTKRTSPDHPSPPAMAVARTIRSWQQSSGIGQAPRTRLRCRRGGAVYPLWRPSPAISCRSADDLGPPYLRGCRKMSLIMQPFIISY